MAVCVAVIAKENYPLYLRSASNRSDGGGVDEDLKFFYTVHTSLDVIEERMFASSSLSSSSSNSSKGSSSDPRELYLGLLYPTEDYRVYGYVTNTKVKFVILVDASNTTLRDNEIRSMFRQLHNAYADLMCNPFYTPGESISHKSFDRIVSGMLAPTTITA